MKKFIIERVIPNIGTFDHNALQEAAVQSCEVIQQLEPKVQWLQSFVTGNKTFCVYLAADEKDIKNHAEISGFPANKITEVLNMISPFTAI